MLGAGAGGSAAAAYLHRHGADVLWLEAGGDESGKLRDVPAKGPRSQPQETWTPTVVQRGDGVRLDYAIPKTAGGMTRHYAGAQFWTMEGTVASLRLRDDHEREALDFVINVTNHPSNVHCASFDPRYHTHVRDASTAAPGTEELLSLPMCMYGECKGGASCDLNQWFASNLGLAAPPMDWYRHSAYVEYAPHAPPVQLHSEAAELLLTNGTATGVRLTDGRLYCARQAILLAAGVMGDARLLLPHVGPYPFFAQPVVVHADPSVPCDPGTVSGGTFHRRGSFLSTLGICRNGTRNHVAWATPQAVDALVVGTLSLDADGTVNATVNFEDARILETLRTSVALAVEALFGIPDFLLTATEISYAAYHWTGDAAVIAPDSRVRGMTNVYAADAMGVTGATDGWTSFNARVAGAIAAHRALRRGGDQVCEELRAIHSSASCCTLEEYAYYCEALAQEYGSNGCCP